MKVALVHDWLLHMRGGEKVLESLAEIFPDAEIYTLICDREKISPSLKSRKIHTSFLQYFPAIKTYYRWLLPALPFVIRSMKIPDVHLVISSSHCVAKGIRRPLNAKHICYCHTPMRYLWGYEKDYFGKYPALIRGMIQVLFKFLKKWDLESNENVDLFIANSENVKKRIREFYRREAEVVYPPLNTDEFFPDHEGERAGYLIVSAFVPYKKLDIVIQAFNGLPHALTVVGSGPLEKEYKRMAQSAKIRFLGTVEGPELRKQYSQAKALIFPTDEDFGIVPLEAQACGLPVIAFGKGGALESVKSGVFFFEQTPSAVKQAVLDFEKQAPQFTEVSEKVQWFRKKSFKNRFQELAGLTVPV